MISNACSNEIDLIAPYKDIPVVFSLLNKADTAHYVRVEKAFLDENTSALEIAQIADSLYYDDVTVRLERIDNGSVAESFTLNRVDGNLEGYPREAGTFANAPNYLYKLVLPNGDELRGGNTYRLAVDRGDNFPEVSAEAVVLGDMEIRVPTVNQEFTWETNTRRQSIRWDFNKDAAVIFDLNIIFNYEEADINNPSVFLPKSVNWAFKRNIQNVDNETTISESFQAVEFFQAMGNLIDATNDVPRKFVGIDIMVTAGGVDLNQYINVGQANLGITSSNIAPTYTNLSEGFGIFSSKATTTRFDRQLKNAALDSLRLGIFTRHLNFQ